MNGARSVWMAVAVMVVAAAAAPAIEIGEPCPPLKGIDQSDQVRDLQAYLGRKYVVVIFYPRDFTPLSIPMAEQLERDHLQFAGRNAVVFAVSNEHPRMHAAFAKHYRLSCPLIADQKDVWRKAFGIEADSGTVSSFIVDLSGKVAGVFRKVTQAGEHVKQLHEELLKLGADRFGYQVGKLAPDVTLPLYRGRQDELFELRSLRGKPVVLLFLCGPKDYTCSQCRALLAGLEQQYSVINELGAEVVVISRGTDTPGSILSTVRQDGLNLPFPVLIDEHQEAASALAALASGRSRTTLIVLDEAGVLRFRRGVVGYHHPEPGHAIEALNTVRARSSTSADPEE